MKNYQNFPKNCNLQKMYDCWIKKLLTESYKIFQENGMQRLKQYIIYNFLVMEK